MSIGYFGGNFDCPDVPNKSVQINEINNISESTVLEPVTYEDTEMREMTHQGLSAAVLEPMYYEDPEIGEILVYGDPFEVGVDLDDNQGDNIYNIQGDCGLVSVTNILRMNDVNVSEDEVVGRALDLGLCTYSEFNSPDVNGSTTVYERLQLLQSYGVNASVFENKNGDASLESIAEYVENGHGVNISINAGYAWDDPGAVGDGSSNHSIIVTGTARDPETSELKGLYVCDSGLTDQNSSAVFLSMDKLEKCYVDAYGSTVLVTDDEIR